MLNQNKSQVNETTGGVFEQHRMLFQSGQKVKRMVLVLDERWR